MLENAASSILRNPLLNDVEHFLGDDREHPEQCEGDQQGRGQDSGKGFELTDLLARVDVDRRARKHADLAHPVERPQPNGGQRHHQVDDEEGEGGNQAQGEQVERAVLLDAFVDRLEKLAEPFLHGVPEEVAGEEAGEGGADAARERYQHETHRQAEDGAGGRAS